MKKTPHESLVESLCVLPQESLKALPLKVIIQESFEEFLWDFLQFMKKQIEMKKPLKYFGVSGVISNIIPEEISEGIRISYSKKIKECLKKFPSESAENSSEVFLKL